MGAVPQFTLTLKFECEGVAPPPETNSLHFKAQLPGRHRPTGGKALLDA